MPDWKNLPPLFPRTALHAAAVAHAEAAPPEEPWCVAFSGGADSLALLLLVGAHWPERRAKLTALHFNHGLRGAESDGDEQFCRDVCTALGVKFFSARWTDAPAAPGEAEARAARHAFFAREMAAAGARLLWTGHQRDDIAETLLMRLARGSGPAGLAAPRPVQEHADGRVFLRPLLTLAKQALIAALNAAGATWREDVSNGTADYYRNRVRLEVVPAWRVAAPNDAYAGASLSRELCEEDDAALETWLAELRVPATADSLDLRALAGKPRALWRRALRRWAPAAALGRAGFEELLAICLSGEGRASLPEGTATLRDGILRRDRTAPAPVWPPTALVPGCSLLFPDGSELRARVLALDDAQRARVLAGSVDPRREAVISLGHDGPLAIRRWQPGDRYRPLGAPGGAKLQDLFVNKGVPAALRSALPVVCDGNGEVIWVPWLPPAEHRRISAQSASGLQLTYCEGTSTVLS